MTLLELLEYTYLAGGYTTKSDFARAEADVTAEAASSGLLTTETPTGGHQSVWRLTPTGVAFMWDELRTFTIPPLKGAA
jgi:hypothetical protein